MNITVTMIFQKQIFKNFLSSASCARQDFHWRISARFFYKPRTTPFYPQTALNALQSQMLTIQQTISEMDLSGQLPMCQSLEQLAGMLADTDFCRKILPGIIRWNPGCPAAGTVFVDGVASGYAGYGISAVCGRKSHSIRLSTPVRI